MFQSHEACQGAYVTGLQKSRAFCLAFSIFILVLLLEIALVILGNVPSEFVATSYQFCNLQLCSRGELGKVQLRFENEVGLQWAFLIIRVLSYSPHQLHNILSSAR